MKEMDDVLVGALHCRMTCMVILVGLLCVAFENNGHLPKLLKFPLLKLTGLFLI